MKTPWAVLLTTFKDETTEPYPQARYEEVFTSAGAGKWNMVDYFRDMSHGRADLSGSQVFPGITLDQNRNDYKGSGSNLPGRKDLVTWARQKAAAKGVNVDAFFSVVVVLATEADLFGDHYGAVCGDDGQNVTISGLSPSLIGQEMGHGWGLQHSRRDGSTDDYKDNYDVMSTQEDARMSMHPLHTERQRQNGQPVFKIGPGLNAANMDALGWLDPSRVWVAPTGAMQATIELRPLHRLDLPGTLAIRMGNYLIEFRMNEDWDAGLEAPGVLVHYFEDGHSYLVPDGNGVDLLQQGQYIATPPGLGPLGAGMSITVASIDANARVARVQLAQTAPQISREWPETGPFQTPWVKWLEAMGGGDAMVVVGGRVVPIGRLSPIRPILEQAALYASIKKPLNARLASDARQEALGEIARIALEEKSKSRFQSPAPAGARSVRRAE